MDQKKINSPLDRIQGLRPVAPEKAQALETRLKRGYVSQMTEYVREARLRAELGRDKVLY